jgi:transcriptional regulator GlxA family with amidase domain
MQVVVLLFEGITALDAIGPYEVLARVPDVDVRFAARTPGLIHSATHSPLTLVADYALDDAPRPDILVVPGGPGQAVVCGDETVLNWIRSAHASTRWTTSVCTGALLLGAAGILRGVRATTHWMSLDALREFGAEPVSQRVVVTGKIITSAGVSAGIDMALQLVALAWGEQSAQMIQLGLEYDPRPPFNVGHPDKAPAALVDRILAAKTRSRR